MLESIYYSVILVFFMTAMVLMAVRSRLLRRGGAGQASLKSQTLISWDGSYTKGFQRALDVLAALGAEVVAADPNRGAISARMPPSPVSLAPFGASLRIALTTQDGITLVNVQAIPSLTGSLGAARLLNQFTQIWDRLPSPVK